MNIIEAKVVFPPDPSRKTSVGNLSLLAELPSNIVPEEVGGTFHEKSGVGQLRVWLGKPHEEDSVYALTLSKGDPVTLVRKGKGWGIEVPRQAYANTNAPARESRSNGEVTQTKKPTSYNSLDDNEKLAFVGLASQYADTILLIMGGINANELAKGMSQEDVRQVAVSAFIQGTYAWPHLREAIMAPAEEVKSIDPYDVYIDSMEKLSKTEPSERHALVSSLAHAFTLSDDEVTLVLKATKKPAVDFFGSEQNWATAYQIIDSYRSKKEELGSEKAIKFIADSFSVGDW